MENILEFPDKSAITDEACEWVIKASRDEPLSADEIVELNAWVAQSPVHRAVLQELASTWADLNLLSDLQVPSESTTSISPPLNSTPIVQRKILGVFLWWLLAPIWLLINSVQNISRGLRAALSQPLGASVALMVVTVSVSSWLYINQGVEHYVTSVGEQSTHLLKDGSSLWLNTNSQVQVEYSATRRKILLLKGEAHFEVEADADRPFEVYAGDRMVRAIGTAFSVYLQDDDVKVMVSEGKVDLAVVMYAQNTQSPEPAIQTSERVGSLEAGQGIVVPANIEGVVNNIVNYEQAELLRRLAWIEGRLVFKGEVLEEVVKEVSRYTPMHIEVVDHHIRQTRIGGSFQVGQTEKLFDALSLGFNVKVVRVSDSHVQLFAQD